MPDVNLPIVPSQLPSGVCPATYQELLNLFAQNMVAVSSIATGAFDNWVFSAAKPADKSVGWFQLDQQGQPVRPYLFAQGAWLSLHPLPLGSTIWYFEPMLPDPATYLNTFDGGSAGAVTTLSGPMWQTATFPTVNGVPIAAQFPIVSGTLPSGTLLNVGDTGGEEKHSLDVTEMPPHTHQTTFNHEPQSGSETQCLTAGNPPADPLVTFDTTSAGGSGNPPVVSPHNTMPPYIVGYLLQRTARKFYAIT